MINKTDLVELKAQMDELNRVNSLFSIEKDEFEKKCAYLVKKKKAAVEKISELKEKIEPAALLEYKETGNKKLSGGVSIRTSKTIQYDIDKAFEWAKEKDMCLMLDKKTFEVAAPGLKLDFFKTGTVDNVSWPKEVKVE